MRIGILTYHRSHNYGAMLQAVALRKSLESMGHEVFFIDYWPQHQRIYYSLFSWKEFRNRGIMGKYYYIKSFLKTLYPKLLRRRSFNRFFQEQIGPFCCSSEKTYDVIVYGSDQIWRKQGYGYGYNPVYFGKNSFRANKHVSYAASMGVLPNNSEDVETVKQYISFLDKISVREISLKNFLISLNIENVELSLDPTLLLTQDEWIKLCKKDRIVKTPYLLFYDLLNDSFDTDEVEKFAHFHSLQVIKLSGVAYNFPSEVNRNTDGPFEFLNLIKYADYIATSSFHGLAFSIIFNKPFFASFIVNSGRAESLLKELSLLDRLLQPKQKFPKHSNTIDWQIANERLHKLSQHSLDYLHKISE